MSNSPPLALKVCGDFACFTRPEFKVERISYDVLTPSAARGMLEAIFWKPEMGYRIERIHVLSKIRHFSIWRNEVNNYQSESSAKSWAKTGVGGYFADGDRAQRHTLGLRDVSYIIEAQIYLKSHATENIAKYRDQFRRRVQRGQCHHQPYLGTREFSAFFEPPSGTEQAIDHSDDLGLMLYDVEFNPNPQGKVQHRQQDGEGRRIIKANAQPRFFRARLDQGILTIPHRPL